MKIYNRDDTDVLWMRLLAGSASARYHRTLNNAGNYKPPEGVDPVALQLACVERVVHFLRETGFKPWKMRPDHAIVVETNGVVETLAMCSTDRRTCAILVYGATNDIPDHRFVKLALSKGKYRLFWYSLSTKTQTEQVTLLVDATNSAKLEPPHDPDFVSAVLYVESFDT